MAATDLLFSQLPNPPGGPVEIVFGDDSGIPAGAVELLASGAITGLRGSIIARVATRLGAAGTITGLRGSVVATYDVNVERPVAATTRNGWQNTQRLRTTFGLSLPHWQDGLVRMLQEIGPPPAPAPRSA